MIRARALSFVASPFLQNAITHPHRLNHTVITEISSTMPCPGTRNEVARPEGPNKLTINAPSTIAL